MRPLDPRLLRWATVTRAFLVLAVVVGVATSILVIVQAVALTDVVVGVFRDGATWDAVSGSMATLAAAIVGRSVLAWAAEAAAHRSAARAKSQLRAALLEHALALGPVRLTAARRGELAVLATRGIDALDAYYARYLPQLVLACIVPLVVGTVILTQDLLAAVTIGLTLPLIPVFMVLIGLYTRSRVDRQWRTLGILSGHYLDVIAGLPTLKVFGRARAQVRGIVEVGERYRATTMGVLRVSFLSALALELLATLSVALIAVGIGLRLVDGELDLRTGLLVLVLAPEVYLPIRLVGVHFHAAAEGLGAAARVFDVLDTPLPQRVRGTLPPPPEPTVIRLERVGVTFDDRPVPALRDLTATLASGRVTALTGPSGCGKSTVLALLLGFLAPTTGRVVLVGADGTEVDLADVDLGAWRERLGYVAQDPWLTSGSIADNVRLGRPDATHDEVAAALAAAGLDLADPDVAATLPAGLATVLGEGGVGVSAGQRRRIALARAFLRDAPVLVLDEPTAALDPATEDLVVEAVRRARRAGRTVVLVAHRPALVAAADGCIALVAPAAAAGLERTDDVSGSAAAPSAVAVAARRSAPTPAAPWQERT